MTCPLNRAGHGLRRSVNLDRPSAVDSGFRSDDCLNVENAERAPHFHAPRFLAQLTMAKL
jgi:hypothetical protein